MRHLCRIDQKNTWFWQEWRQLEECGFAKTVEEYFLPVRSRFFYRKGLGGCAKVTKGFYLKNVERWMINVEARKVKSWSFEPAPWVWHLFRIGKKIPGFWPDWHQSRKLGIAKTDDDNFLNGIWPYRKMVLPQRSRRSRKGHKGILNENVERWKVNSEARKVQSWSFDPAPWVRHLCRIVKKNT